MFTPEALDSCQTLAFFLNSECWRALNQRLSTQTIDLFPPKSIWASAIFWIEKKKIIEKQTKVWQRSNPFGLFISKYATCVYVFFFNCCKFVHIFTTTMNYFPA